MKIVVIGAGEIGKTLCNILTAENHEVTIVEADQERAEKLAGETDALVLNGDATSMSILKDAGIEECDAIIAVTDDDKTNLMVCEIAKSSDVKRIISRISNPGNEELFTKLGITSVVPVVGNTVTAIKQMLIADGGRVIAQIGKGDVQVIEVTIHENSKLIGRPAAIKNAVIGTIYRSGDLIIPMKNTMLKNGDVLILTAKSRNLSRIRKVISGD
ncbi:MAG: NAD-binding protein [archaeon]